MTTKSRNDLPAELDIIRTSKTVTVVSGKWRLSINLLVGEHTLRYSELRELAPKGHLALPILRNLLEIGHIFN